MTKRTETVNTELVSRDYDKIVYLVRHGEAETDGGLLYQKLTTRGEVQARALLQHFKAQVNFKKFDKVYTSAVKCAMDTASELCHLGKGSYSTIDALFEHGRLDAKAFNNLKYELSDAKHLLGGENTNRTLAVSHGRVIRTLTLSFLRGDALTLEDVNSSLMGMDPTGVTILGHLRNCLTPGHSGWVLLRLNDVSHLPADMQAQQF